MVSSRRIALSIAAILLSGLPTLPAQSDLRFDSVASTPYDSQLARVNRYLNTKASPSARKLSLDQVNEWMNQLHGVPYEFCASWKTPDELRSSAKGDCKAKSISLYYLMKASGAKNLLLIIGRERYSRPDSHSWLIWQVGGHHYLLDPTHNKRAVEVFAFDPDNYIPHFAYAAKKKFRPGVAPPESPSLNAKAKSSDEILAGSFLFAARD